LQINGRQAKKQYVVPSESSGKEYIVTEYDDPPFDNQHHPKWACGCIGWTRHFPRRECKHILYAQAGGARTFEEAIANKLDGGLSV
jgi:hypothetical protein